MVTGRELANKIVASAGRLGMDPLDYATAISYETGGTFNPVQKGPTTKWGQHKGFIQFGEPQAKQYGVDWNNPVDSQLGEGGAVEKYFTQNGYKPGMDYRDVYSIINAGAPGRYNATDEAAGGAPGTVSDKVNSEQMMAHRAKAAQLLEGSYEPRISTSGRGNTDMPAPRTILDPRRSGSLLDQEPTVEEPKGFLEQVKASAKGGGLDINAGLSSLAEIITANARGEKADLAGVGAEWRAKRAGDTALAKEEQARQAAKYLFNDGTEAGNAAIEALSQGADLTSVMSSYQASTGRDFSREMQTDSQAAASALAQQNNAFTAGQNELNRAQETSERLGTQGFTLNRDMVDYSFRAGESAADRDLRIRTQEKDIAAAAGLQDNSQQFTAAQNAQANAWDVEADGVQNGFTAGESAKDRAMRLGEHDDNLAVDYEQLDLRRQEIENDDRFKTNAQRIDQYQFDTEMEITAAKYEQERGQTQDEGAAGKAAVIATLESIGDTELLAKVEAMPEAGFTPAVVGQMFDAAEILNPISTDEMTSDMKEAIWLADPNVSDEMKNALRTMQERDAGTETPATAAAKTWNEEGIKKDVAKMSEMGDKQATTTSMFNAITEMQTLMDANNGDLNTGIITKTLDGAIRAAQQLGLLGEDVSAMADDRARFDALAAAVFPSLRPTGSGATSDWEGGVYEKAFPNIGNTAATMTGQLEYYRNSLQQQQNQITFLQQTVGPEVRMQDALDQWKQKVDRGDPEASNTYYNADKITEANAADAVANSKLGIGSWVVMGGKPYLIGSQDTLDLFLQSTKGRN
jgi:hypothetical protein